ncbi:ATP-binding cassette domain-containing protein [Actinoplanes awajinensis]|uniref:Multidrug ABC transporter ATP-binding protein n=1 Tax=Actinoplanes awajinensis subsp. mycoplanecinus TaxID=135947 RepID=A0A124G8X1_9ACTN|nr:ATP-binding cassette domain-containing protein [Actinoplanes awajinensis]KUL27310.1 multidrug ABC transporter ATP-binding protein [Actinoplanes awajinensis subsp. mycoplanecinus]
MIEVDELVKRFGKTTAVDGLSFVVRPGRVTGFLGPNGAGKSTTMRMILGLDRPTAGRATVNGKPYREHPAPLATAGALLEGRAVHGGRSARDHLLGLARTHGIGRARVDEVLEQAGIAAVAGRRAGGFSLGMGQRLGIAAALLGDPAVVILDEPVNGLDPDGVLWIRTLLRQLAAEGRTVLISSHLMSEMAVTADHLLVIGKGRLLADAALDDLLGRATSLVRSPDADVLRELLVANGATVTAPAAGRLDVTGLDVTEIGTVAAAHQLRIFELTPARASLEDAYMALVRS